MTRKDRQQASDLDRYWDDVVLTGRSPESELLDRATADLIDRLWAAGAPPDPTHASERVWLQLQGEQERKEHEMDARALGAMASHALWSPVNPYGRVTPWPSLSSGHARWRGMTGQLATAALLVLVLAAGLFAAGPLRPTREASEPAGLPAVIMAPATPTAVASEETLLEITIPAEFLPQGDRISTVFEQATSPAGSTGRWLAANSAGLPGLRVHYVLDGSVVMRAESAAQVLRAGGTSMLEVVPAGMDVTLKTGDTWITRNETVFEAVNPAKAPTELLLWVVANIEDPAGAFLYYAVPSNWVENNFIPDPTVVEEPSGPTTLRIRRVELPAKGRLPAPATGLQYGVTMLTNADGTPILGPSVGNLPDGRLINNGKKPATVYVLNFSSAKTEAGTPAVGAPAP